MWGVGGVGAWCQWPRGRGFSCLHRIMFLCSAVSYKGFRRGKGLRTGLLVALGECHGVFVWYYDVDMAADEDLDEEEMGLARTEGPDLAPLECSSAAEVQNFIKDSRPR